MRVTNCLFHGGRFPGGWFFRDVRFDDGRAGLENRAADGPEVPENRTADSPGVSENRAVNVPEASENRTTDGPEVPGRRAAVLGGPHRRSGRWMEGPKGDLGHGCSKPCRAIHSRLSRKEMVSWMTNC